MPELCRVKGTTLYAFGVRPADFHDSSFTVATAFSRTYDYYGRQYDKGLHAGLTFWLHREGSRWRNAERARGA